MSDDTETQKSLDTVLSSPGVLRAETDEEARALTIHYDPRLLSDEAVRAMAESAAPTRRHFEKALLYLRGRASEAAAMKMERRAEQIAGVRRATATFIGGVMAVTYDASELPAGQVLPRVRESGAPVAADTRPPPEFWARVRFWAQSDRLELVFTVLTFLFMMSGWLAPKLGATGASSALLFGLAYFTGGFFGVQAAYQSLRERTIDVDLLMVLAALGAAVVGAPFEGAMLLFLFSLSNVLQSYAIDRTRKAIRSLMKLRPDKALTRRNGHTELLPIEDLIVGDIVVVRPGESIPLDSVILEGDSAIDESSLTGESIPVSKSAGDPVFAGTINQTGGLEVEVAKLSKDSTIEKLIRMVEAAQSEKAKAQRFLDRAEQFYAMGVIAFTLALIGVPLFLLGHEFGPTFYRAMTVMVVASPCALIISTPASILSAIGGAARRGVLFKGGMHLEQAAEVEVVAFDKTGTLTAGQPRVVALVTPDGGCDATSSLPPAAAALLEMAAAVESKSEHPLARAIVEEAERRGIDSSDCSDFQSASGLGASGVVRGRRVVIGNDRFFATMRTVCPNAIRQEVEKLQNDGKTCILVAELDSDGSEPRVLGAIAVADVLRSDAAEVVRRLKNSGIRRVVLMTGDNAGVAAAIARQAGVDEFHANLLPEDKVRLIQELRQIGPVAMVGDGVNDAPALASATVGIAMGAAGTDVAMETADVVLMSDNLNNIPFALELSRHARRVVYQNLGFALVTIVLLVIGALGFSLPLTLGVVGHEGSTVLVCLNGLRLLRFTGTR